MLSYLPVLHGLPGCVFVPQASPEQKEVAINAYWDVVSANYKATTNHTLALGQFPPGQVQLPRYTATYPLGPFFITQTCSLVGKDPAWPVFFFAPCCFVQVFFGF